MVPPQRERERETGLVHATCTIPTRSVSHSRENEEREGE